MEKGWGGSSLRLQGVDGSSRFHLSEAHFVVEDLPARTYRAAPYEAC